MDHYLAWLADRKSKVINLCVSEDPSSKMAVSLYHSYRFLPMYTPINKHDWSDAILLLLALQVQCALHVKCESDHVSGTTTELKVQCRGESPKDPFIMFIGLINVYICHYHT